MAIDRITRRTFTASAAGFAAGLFATSLPNVSAQDAATPVAVLPQGYVSTRVRTIASADARDDVNALVLDQFVPDVQALEGYRGYAVGDVIDHGDQSLSILVLENTEQEAAFAELAAGFVEGVEETVTTVSTERWSGDLLIAGGVDLGAATPATAPVTGMRDGYIAVRVHTSTPGTNPSDFVPLATTGFLPIISGLPGFEGYLWYPTEGGFVAISFFDTVESAEASNAAAQDWAVEFLTEYTDGNPRIINANVVFADLPILAGL